MFSYIIDRACPTPDKIVVRSSHDLSLFVLAKGFDMDDVILDICVCFVVLWNLFCNCDIFKDRKNKRTNGNKRPDDPFEM